ncbi:hypothetical protein [Sphingomonas baiyangensis]|uniref:Lipoprotein n=1 Tax=Sphingomonas baiyangensis TaxID=2572576 RepID=A0A4U1L4T3_9SPHN|nr:hypothetical protein [Sphingomonas baiyangensis]TKD51792.1 hypothetical protein FBR43_14300 [Sphingomonas baiyangensis]
MPYYRPIIAIGAVAMIAGCTTTPEAAQRAASIQADRTAELEAKLAGYTPEEPRTCVSLTQLNQSETFGSTILYRASPGLYYRNDTSGNCGDRRDDILVTRTPSTQLCSGEIVRTIDRFQRFQTGACTLNAFVPYRRDRDES